jgi:hypothetical protein
LQKILAPLNNYFLIISDAPTPWTFIVLNGLKVQSPWAIEEISIQNLDLHSSTISRME